MLRDKTKHDIPLFNSYLTPKIINLGIVKRLKNLIHNKCYTDLKLNKNNTY